MESARPTSRINRRHSTAGIKEHLPLSGEEQRLFREGAPSRRHPGAPVNPTSPRAGGLLGWWVHTLVRTVAPFLPVPEKEVARFLKFAMVGTLGAAIDFSLLNLFHFVFGWTKFWANTGSFSIAVCSNFLWNRYWTFPESRARPVYKQLPMFFAVYVVGYFINQSVFLGSDAYLFSQLFPPALSVNLAKALANLVGLFWNFTANRFSTYRGL